MMKVNEKDETSETPGYDSLSSISSDEGSFVVLGTSPERQPASSITISSQQPSINEFTSTHYQPPSNSLLSPDLSTEEFHKKLEEVMQHNLNLKELLYQNNLSWKHNYQILLTWQEELSKQQQKNIEKFAENKEFTMKLEAENSELKEKIAELQQRLVALSSKAEITECSTPSERELVVSSGWEQLNEQWQDLVTKSNHSGENCTFSQLDIRTDEKTDFTTKMKIYERQFQEMDRNLKEKTERINSANAQTQTDCQELLEERKPLHEEQNMKVKQNSEYHEFQVQGCIAKVENLTSQLVSKEEALTQHKQQIAELTDAVKILKQENEEISVLKAQVIQNSEYHEFQVQDYTGKIDSLTAQLLSKETALAQHKQQISDLTDAVERLKKDSEEIPLLKAQVIQNSEYHEFQVQDYTEKVDSLTAQLLSKETALAQHKQQISDLTDAVERFKKDSEEIPLLKAQLEVYQLDCIAEIEARANLAGEKEKIAEDLRRLHRQNKELREKLEMYSADRGHSNSGPGRPHWSANHSTQ